METDKLLEETTRKIRENHDKILNDFFIAYAANLAHLGEDVNLKDICLVEQIPTYKDNVYAQRYWFEFKPKFDKKLTNPEGFENG